MFSVNQIIILFVVSKKW